MINDRITSTTSVFGDDKVVADWVNRVDSNKPVFLNKDLIGIPIPKGVYIEIPGDKVEEGTPPSVEPPLGVDDGHTEIGG